MANREFSVLFKINAALSEQFGDALKSAQNAMKGMAGVSKYTSGVMSKNMQNLQSKYADMNKIALQMQKYRNLQTSLDNTRLTYNKSHADNARLQQNYADESQRLRDMQKAYKQMQSYFKENKSAMSADDKSFYQAQLQQARDELKAQKLRQREAGQAVTKQSNEMQRLHSQLNSQQSALNAARSALQSAGISAETFANQEARLRAEIERTNQAIERQGQIDSRRERFNQAGQNLSNSYGEFQAATDTAKSIMSPFKSAIDEAASYEKEFSRLKALTQTKNIRAGDFETVNKEMAGLDETIKHLGATTEFTNIDVLGAANKFAMSGWSPEQIKNTLPSLIDVATASGERDLIKLGDYMSDELQALGLTKGSPQEVAKNISHYADLMTYGMNQSNNDLESFHQAMKYFAPVGTQLGMKPEEMVAAVMTQADAGIKGSMGGTSMRMASLRMFAPPKAAMKALEQMGELSSDAQKSLAEAGQVWSELGVSEDAGWLDRMKALKEASKSMSKSDFMAKLSKITGVNAVSGQASLLADFEKFEERLDMMTNGGVDNWAQDVAGTMRDNTATQFALFESAVSGLAVTVGSMFLPIVRQATQAITSFTSGLDTFAQANPGIVQGVASVAAGLSGLIVASAGAKLAMAGFEYVSSGFGVLKDMVTSVGTTLLSFPARISSAFAMIRGFSFASMFAGIGPALLPAIGIAAALAAAAYFVISNWSSVAPILSNIGSTISSSLSTAFSALAPAISNLMSALGNIATALAPLFGILGAGISAALLTALNTVANVAATIISTFANAFATVINLVSGLGNTIGLLFQGKFAEAGQALVQTFSDVVSGIKETLSSLFDGLGNTFSTFLDPVKSLMGMKITAPEVSAPTATTEFKLPEFNIPEVKMPDSLTIPNAEIQNANIQGTEQLQPTQPAETSTVQAQSVAVQANEIQQTEQSTGLQETVAQLQSAVQPIAESFAQMSASVQPVSEGFTNLSASVQPVGETFTQLSASIPMVAESFNQINTGVTTFNSELTNTGAQLQSANAAVQAFSSSLTATNGAITGFTGALTGSVGAVTGLGSAASGASGAISGLGSAASAACAALAAAGANAAAAVSAAAASIPTAPVAANYRGGIYPKGEFITTFAEKSAEAAIPLDKSARAVSLWEQVGQILGVYQGDKNINYEPTPKFDSLGNIEGLNGLADNIISEFDSIQVARSKKEAQLKEFNSKMSKVKPDKPAKNIFSGIGNIFNRNSSVSDIFTSTVSNKNSLSESSIFSKNVGGNIFEDITEIFTGGNIFENIGTIFRDNIGGNNFGDVADIFTSTTGKSSGGNIFESAGALLADNLIPAQSSVDNGFNITFEVNIAGNANAEDVRTGIEQAIPSVEDFAQRLSDWRHEQQRISFA